MLLAAELLSPSREIEVDSGKPEGVNRGSGIE